METVSLMRDEIDDYIHDAVNQLERELGEGRTDEFQRTTFNLFAQKTYKYPAIQLSAL